MVFSRLRIAAPGPGFVHLPDWADEEYLAQLTAEKAIRKYVKGRGAVREWIKVRERNEALDLEVYALAALHILGQAFIRGLAARAAKLAMPMLDLEPREQPEPSPMPPKRPWIPRRPGGWMNGLR
jgi:phage terminase large subunit GpA-like protein